MLTSKIITEIIENSSEVSRCVRTAAKNTVCFKSILINHESTYDAFMKRHLLWGAVCKNIISDRFSTKSAISAHI